MSNAFDLERAKAGEAIEYNSGGGRWVRAHFIGVCSNHRTAIQYQHGFSDGLPSMSAPFMCNAPELRMASKTVKVRYRNYMLKDAVHISVSMIADTPGYETPEGIEKKSWFKGWIHTEWQVVEVPQ